MTNENPRIGNVAEAYILTDTKPGWRVNYYINIAVAGMAVVLFYFFCRNTRPSFPDEADSLQTIPQTSSCCTKIAAKWNNSNVKMVLALSFSLEVLYYSSWVSAGVEPFTHGSLVMSLARKQNSWR